MITCIIANAIAVSQIGYYFTCRCIKPEDIPMGNSGSNEDAISEEAMDEYVELTYLSKSEIRQWVHKRNLEETDKI